MTAPQAPEEPDLFMAQILYREWGRRFNFLQKYLKSIQYYEESLEHEGDNLLWTLVGLSDSYKKSGQFKVAAEAAKKCMELDSSHMGANWTRMEALFDIAEYCFSLVYAHQGMRKMTMFRPAVLLANETVEDCVGANVPPDTLRILQPWIRKLTEHRAMVLESMNAEEDEFEGIGEEQTRFKINDPDSKLRQYQKKIDRLIAPMYLGASAKDKVFIIEFLRHPAVPSANKSGSERLAEVTASNLKRIQAQQEALRTRGPLYAVRGARKAAISPGCAKVLEQQLEHRRCLILNLAKFMLRQLHAARKRRDYMSFFKLVERGKEKFESYNLDLFPERQRYLDAIYKMVARVYIDPRNLMRFPPCMEEWRAATLRKLLGLKGPRLPRDTDLAWLPTYNLKQTLAKCRERLACATKPLEMLWLFHELCKLCLEIDRSELARFFVKKIQHLGEDTGYEDWILNANHILVRIELSQQNRNEAKEAATACLESAKKLDLDYAIDFYEHVIDFIENYEFAQISDDEGIVSREKLISNLMPSDLKPGMDLLLRSMGAVKAKRRLSVMPGCKTKDNGGFSGKMSALPAPPFDFETEARIELLRKFAPSKDILGIVDFNKYD